MILLRERPGEQFYLALAIMLFSTAVMIKDTVIREKLQEDQA